MQSKRGYEAFRQIIKAVFWETEIDAYLEEVLYSRFDAVLQTLNERERCVVEKRIEGMTYEKAGKIIVNMHPARRYCDGLGVERCRQIYVKAVRKMQHKSRRPLWNGEISGEEWNRQMIGLKT